MIKLLQIMTFSYSLMVGVNDGLLVQYVSDPPASEHIEIDIPLFIDLQAELAMGPLFVGGGIRNDFKPTTWNDYKPQQDAYTFRTGARFTLSDGFDIEAGYAHTCFHPRECYSMVRYLNGQKIAVPAFEGAVDEFYVVIRGRVGG